MSADPVVAVMSAVIARHQPNEWGQHDGWWECCCSHDATVPWSAEHVAEAVAAAVREAGLAVVRRHTGSGGGTPTGEFAAICVDCQSYWPCDVERAVVAEGER